MAIYMRMMLNQSIDFQNTYAESKLTWELRFADVSKIVLLTANLFQRINLRIYYRQPILVGGFTPSEKY